MSQQLQAYRSIGCGASVGFIMPASAIGEGNRQGACLQRLNDLPDTKIDTL